MIPSKDALGQCVFEYEYRHYDPTASKTWIQSWNASSPFRERDDMDITYWQLQDAHKARLEAERSTISQQSLRNHVSVLKTYLTYLGKSPESKIGKEFLDEFKIKAIQYVDTVCAGKTKTAADKMSILRAWRKTVESLQSVQRQKKSSAVPEERFASAFHSKLRAAIARSGKTPALLAREICLSGSTIHGWLSGNIPHETMGLPALRRLELALSLARGDLERLLPPPVRLPAMSTKVDAYSRRHAVNHMDCYILPTEELTPEFCKEWFELLRYKTSECRKRPIDDVTDSRGDETVGG